MNRKCSKNIFPPYESSNLEYFSDGDDYSEEILKLISP